jgi:hypothetical protein
MEECYFHISQISLLFKSRRDKGQNDTSVSEIDHAELILCAKGSISQLGLLYHEIISQTTKICTSISYWENLGSTRNWIISIPSYFLKDKSWKSRVERLKLLNVMLRDRQELLGRLGSILEKLGMLRRDFSVGRSSFELNTILLTAVAMVTRVVSQILFPNEFRAQNEKDFLNGNRLRVMSERHATQFHSKLFNMQKQFQKEFKNIKRPSIWRRRWFEIVTSSAVTVYFAYFSFTRPGKIEDIRKRLHTTASDFVFEHVTDPISSLWNEIILHKGYNVIDASEVLDSKYSLDIMLRDFLIMKRPGISEAEVDFMLDSGVVLEELSRSYEAAIKAPYVLCL